SLLVSFRCAYNKPFRMNSVTLEDLYKVMEIWEHPCPAYVKLREKIKPKAEKMLKWEILIPKDSLYKVPVDTTKEIIRW
ncbi:MAG TPA: hypothetical protein VNX68_17410, partial [Nitrosopumilaceae archaeon]|nr:hypothetical protein [Nitrosopumilaceae archaeon]